MTDVWGNFTQGIPEYAVDAFSAVDPWFYPILLVGIIGYIYGCMNSATSAIVAIIITLGIFGVTTSVFEGEGIPIVTQFLYIITVVGLTLLIVNLMLHRRRVM